MSNRTPLNLLLPPGRLVSGSVHEAQTKDADNKPIVYKTGDKAGQPAKRWYFALAIPKTPGLGHWAHEAWGALIWARGHADFPQGNAQLPSFAWKIEDGDSTVPNKKMKKNCDREGFPGCWIIRMQSMVEPKTYTTMGQPAGNPARAIDATQIKTGYFVEVFVGIDGNDDVGRNPGLFINPSMVNLIGFGTEIVGGPDVSQAGFGAAAAPAGASLAPPANFNPNTAPAAPVAPAPVSAPPAPVSAPPAPVAPAPVPTAAPPAPVPVQAQPAILPAVPPPPAPAPVAPAPGFTMTAKANGITRESYLASGWTDDLLRQHGMML